MDAESRRLDALEVELRLALRAIETTRAKLNEECRTLARELRLAEQLHK